MRLYIPNQPLSPTPCLEIKVCISDSSILELVPGWWWEVRFCDVLANFHVNFMYPFFKEGDVN